MFFQTTNEEKENVHIKAAFHNVATIPLVKLGRRNYSARQDQMHVYGMTV